MANKEFEDLMRGTEALLEKIKSPSSDLDDDMVVLHWNEAARTWNKILWSDWMKFRAFRDEFRPLSDIRAGDHCFVVCVTDEHQNLFNILPHRYRLDRDGRITDHHFDDLSTSERAFISKWQLSQEAPTGADADRRDALRERMWRSWLPTQEAATILIRHLPGFPTSSFDRPAIEFLSAFGITAQNRSAN
jgi:hypothetical protein